MITNSMTRQVTIVEDKKKMNLGLFTILEECIDMIQKTGDDGGWYIGDSIVIKTNITCSSNDDYTSEAEVLEEEIPINLDESVEKYNAMYGEGTFHTTNWCIEEFMLRKLMPLINKVVYKHLKLYKINTLTISIDMTYEPENK